MLIEKGRFSMAEKEYAGNFSETKYLSFQIIEEIDFLKAK